MTPRIVRLAVLLAMVLAHAPAEAQQPSGDGSSLRAFGSERELIEYLRPPPPPLPPPPILATPPSVPPADPSCTAATSATVTPRPAQGGALIRGRVTDSGGAAQASVTVRVSPLNVGTITAADGEYRIVVPASVLPQPTAVSIRAARVGLEGQSRSVTLSAGDSAVVDFSLCAAALHLEGLTVSATGQPAAARSLGSSVTNVQHAGADEGGIVKLHGNHLVMLRRGRLFTVAIGGGSLEPVSMVDAFGPGLDPGGAWYDELLIHDETVIVIGYSYQRGGTEVGLFHIDRAGRLTHRSTYHLRSNDYYSSRNYASRLVDGKLVFYTPLGLRSTHGGTPEQDASALMPQLRRWRPGATAAEFRPIATAQQVYRPERPLGRAAALHTVTVCDLDDGELDCRAQGVLGPFGHTFYVSPEAVYVWLRGLPARAEGGPDGTLLYRIPLDGRGPTALGVRGSPVDQFGFLESDDGHLNVLVRAGGGGQWMWQGERTSGAAALLRVPLRTFGDGSRDAPEEAYRPLPAPANGAFQNRFVGDHLLYGVGSGWGHPAEAENAGLYVVDWRRGGVAWLATAHPVDRIEPMGSGAVVIGATARNLHFTSVQLARGARVVDWYLLPDAAQGELRSHGFFYRADDARNGVLGLPVAHAGRPGSAHLREGSASVLFLRNRALRMDELGHLASRAAARADDDCRASCVDWYGNARPLFVDGRIFALLGYEIVEGRVQQGRIREVRRVDYTPGPARVARGDD
jgi:hypothetical protein